MFRLRRGIWILLLLGAAAPVRAQSALPPQAEAPILLRILAYDRALDRTPGDNLVIAILYDVKNGTSNHARSSMTRAFRSAQVQSIGGRSLKYVELNVAASNVADAFRQEAVAAAYDTPGLDDRLPAIVTAAADSHVTTLGGNLGYARRGVAVAVDTANGRPQIYVNLAAARASGADLTSSLLKLATVIK